MKRRWYSSATWRNKGPLQLIRHWLLFQKVSLRPVIKINSSVLSTVDNFWYHGCMATSTNCLDVEFLGFVRKAATVFDQRRHDVENNSSLSRCLKLMFARLIFSVSSWMIQKSGPRTAFLYVFQMHFTFIAWILYQVIYGAMKAPLQQWTSLTFTPH